MPCRNAPPIHRKTTKEIERQVDVVGTGYAAKTVASLKWFNAESMLWLSKVYSIRHEGNMCVWP